MDSSKQILQKTKIMHIPSLHGYVMVIVMVTQVNSNKTPLKHPFYICPSSDSARSHLSLYI